MKSSDIPLLDSIPSLDRDGNKCFLAYCGGRWIEGASGETIAVVQPASQQPVGCVATVGSVGVEAAVNAGLEAQRAWMTGYSAGERALRMVEIAQRIEANADDLAMLEACTSGNPVSAMRRDVRKGAEIFRHMSGLGLLLHGETVPVMKAALHYTKLEPYGVVARIVAFNHPFIFACGRIATALASGNAVLLKPSELTPLSALALAALVGDILPPGLLSVLPGTSQLGKALVTNPRIQRISFTGSLKTAVAITAEAAVSGHIKAFSFELGGKNPMIVCSDANVDAAARAAVRGMNFSAVQGQSCGSTSRVFVHDDIHDDFVSRVAELTAELQVGLPEDEQTDVGSMITRQAMDRSLDYTRLAAASGARCETGGRARVDGALRLGNFVEPTVLSMVRDDMAVAQEEIFGPVMSILRWTDQRNVIERANALNYGLTSSVWSDDLRQALNIADALEAGYVWVNEVERRHYAIAFGGWKDSGVGAEYGMDELVSLTRKKTFVVNYGGLD